MIGKVGRFGSFLGCSQFPRCSFTQQPAGQQAATPPVLPPQYAAAPVQPQPQPLPAAPAGSLDAMIRDIAQRAASESVNETRVREIVEEAQQARQEMTPEVVAEMVAAAVTAATRPISFVVQIGSAPPIHIKGTAHKALARVIKLASVRKSATDKTRRFNILLVGPAGSGKTYLAEQVAEALSLPFATQSCALGLPESTFIGRNVPNLSTGAEVYHGTPFTECYGNGGVYCLDEVDNGDASTLLIMNSALANGHITLPSGQRLARHDDFVMIASANTYGHGQSREYVGRGQLDAAFLDRFIGATLEMDYDGALEMALVPEREIRDRVQSIRETCKRTPIRRIVSTRAVIAARSLVLEVGDSIDEAMLALTVGWTVEDRRACGIEAASV